MLQPMEEMNLPPKRQAVVDRLRRRIETYRRRQSECVPRFDQSFSGSCEQQNLETSALQKRFLEGKAKRQAKKTDRKPDLPAISSNLHSSVHVSCQQKFGCGDYEPPAKLQCGGGGGAGGGASEGLTKFSVEIVQQLEFTTSAADSQPQQISTNVTVKALANAVKSSGSPPPSQPPRVPSPLDCERECKAECKSEVADDEFVGLDECAAALERDAASAFPGLADLIGEDDGDDAFEYLITEISEYPELMKDFDLDGGKMNGGGGGLGGLEPPEGEPAPRPYGGGEMSPAAQTLKHMAEQHQQATGGDWARYRGYGGYRPRPTQPPLDHLHMSQQQQLHLSQPHHNLQVSAAQHMQVSGNTSGHVSAAAQQGMYATFQHQGTPSPQHHQGSGCDSYSVSQSQSMNFSPSMRARPAGPTQQTAQGPAQQPLGIAAAGISREQQAKMLQQQQQQMLRAQQQQMRPPPPEYKARFASVNAGPRRPAAPPPRAFPPHARQYAPDWRHVLIQQQSARQQFPHHHQGIMIQYGWNGRHGQRGRSKRRYDATAATSDAAGSTSAAATYAASAAKGIESAVFNVASNYATKSNDERARTDAEYPHESVAEHEHTAGRYGGNGTHADPATHAPPDQHHAVSKHVRKRTHGSEREHAPVLAPLRVFLPGANRGLQPGLPGQHAFHGRQQPYCSGVAQFTGQFIFERYIINRPCMVRNEWMFVFTTIPLVVA